MIYATVLWELADKGYFHWHEIVDKMDDHDKCELSHRAENFSRIMKAISEYLDYRGAVGCGDHGDREGLVHAVKILEGRPRVRG